MADEGRRYHDGQTWTGYDCMEAAELVLDSHRSASYYDRIDLIREEFFAVVGGPPCLGTGCITADDFP